jgi:hypothetical protein
MATTARNSLVSDCIIEELVNVTDKSKINIIEEALKAYRSGLMINAVTVRR